MIGLFHHTKLLVSSLVLLGTLTISMAAEAAPDLGKSNVLRDLVDQDGEDSPLVARQLDNIFRRIVDNDDNDPPLGARGDLCLVTPAGADTPAIWHEQPVIVFNPGIIEKIALRDETAYDPNDPYKSFWEYRPTPTTSHVVYDGEPLQSERIYSVDIYLDADDESPTTFPIFQLLSEDSRQQIATELALQTTPKNNNDVPTEDWTAIQQADYFIEQGLRLDAIQALFNVESPTPELATMQQQMIESVCSQD